MILFTRAVAQDFRTLFGRCVTGRPRGLAPAVVIRIRDSERTIASTTTDGVILTHTTPAPKEPDDLLVLPSDVFPEVEAGTDEVVTLDRETKLRGKLNWHARSHPRTLPVELILPGKQHELPDLPPLKPGSASLLTALHECGRTAAKESGRFALSKVQVQGKAGRVVGTDGKVALLWRGFTFPFSDDLLVPAIPVFGAKPLARITDVKIGRTVTHLIIGAGMWSVWLPIDTRAKYPDVAAVIPRSAPTTLTIDQTDASALLPVLPGLPSADHELRQVTLDAGATVRVLGEKDGSVQAVPLARSTVTGPAIRVALDRRVLARALSLGCRTWKLTPDRAVVAEGADLTVLAAQLDPALVTSEVPETEIPKHTPPERKPPMKPEPNGHAPARDDPPDPLALAEDLRDALNDAATKAARLVSALRQTKKEKKVLSAVLSGLKQLNLNGDGGAR